MKNHSKITNAIITGDLTINWNLAHTHKQGGKGKDWNTVSSTRAFEQQGGAALLAELVHAIVVQLHSSGQAEWEIHQLKLPKDSVLPGDAQYNHSYAKWSLFPQSTRPSESTQKVWRVEEFLGLNKRDDSALNDGQRVANETDDAQIVVLDDANLGFRDLREAWPEAIANPKRHPWVLLKMARPVVSGALWDHLWKHHADKLIMVMSISDLRMSEVQISRELSWERTAQDLVWELQYNPRVNALSKCAHVIISFDTAGAFLMSNGEKMNTPDSRCTLFFDPMVIEGVWGQDHPGGMIGYTSCLTVGIARQLMISNEHPDIGAGIQSGLSAMRMLHLQGYGKPDTDARNACLEFPHSLIVSELAAENKRFSQIAVKMPARVLDKSARTSYWSILEDRYTRDLTQTANEIVLTGVEHAIKDVPVGRFGGLVTIDRKEIESFRTIRRLIKEYAEQTETKRPFSIAVFGPPGSGKSFGVTEVARSILPERIKDLVFNVSQLNDTTDLFGAFHQVRDVTIRGQIPLVFWDEFDTSFAGKSLGWLRYFLSPMQDGSFQEGQIRHPLGRCIFVFAGGMSGSMESFDKIVSPQEFIALKGPDFVSRLKGYVNVLGPNKQKRIDGIPDPYYIIRRAILLRSILLRGTSQLFQPRDGKMIPNMDRGLLRAFLETSEYKHGVRSMESIVAMSALAGKNRFDRSSLPAGEQLDLHVDARDFLALMYQLKLEGELLESLAEAAHDVFCEKLRKEGYSLGLQTDPQIRTHSSLKPYIQLPEDEKEQNRDTVRDIPAKLEQIGFTMVPAREGGAYLEFSQQDLERLAVMEHDRWLRLKIASEWHWSAETDKHRKLHKDIVPWDSLNREERRQRYTSDGLDALGPGELSEGEKEKDRELVRGIPVILNKAGFRIQRLTIKRSIETNHELNGDGG